MELFDKRFVHFMWDDELKGKNVFVADTIDALIFAVRNDGECGVKTNALRCSSRASLPFLDSIFNNCYPFAYYDPNYEVKRAYYKEGKKIEFRPKDEHLSWMPCVNPSWKNDVEYRVKPEEEKWCVYLARPKVGNCYLTASFEYMWEIVQKKYNAKTKLFVGTESEIEERYKSRKKFAEVIKAWEDGKEIQYKVHYGCGWMSATKPIWELDTEYRIKPDEEKADITKKWRPYESSAEMIMDFIDRFKVNCPPNCKPLIWVFDAQMKSQDLIESFVGDGVMILNEKVDFKELLEIYQFLDGTPVGMGVEK